MALELELKKLGLSDKEAKVYVALLEIGEGPVQEIAQKSGVNRATTYVILDSLMKQGIVSTVEKGKKTHYAAENPEALLRLFRLQEEEIKAKEKEFVSALPELQAIFNRAGVKPRVRFFEGRESIEAVRRDVVKSRVDELVTFGAPDEAFALLPPAANDERHRLIAKVKVRTLYTSKQGNKPLGGEYRELPADRYALSGEINVYGDKIAMISYREKPSGVIIESADLATSLRQVFNALWDRLSS
ncbi:BlaI/MecI/CopY family transcriptional regulator [Candidatus Parcubacteria bacterium]|nr:BlaI/MecI/CopY family transcriptional regulator [Candidatus Parcubacteria bacterium]